jgi:predicted esterase YcpF (UPF0227 family)
MRYLYLHGFASSPQSAKAKYLHDRFRSRHLELILPDLNQDNFAELTLTRQIEQVETIVTTLAEPVTLIGSSLGGLTATWVAERQAQVEQLVLLAPAFGFVDHWRLRLGSQTLEQWQQTGRLSVFHYAKHQELDLNYGFLQDCEQYDDRTLQRSLPTLILHGTQDEVIPLEASQNFAQNRPWVQLMALNSDHALGNAVSQIWRSIQAFCKLT